FSYVFIQHAFDEYLMGTPDLCAALLKSSRFRRHPDLRDQLPFTPLSTAAEMLHVDSDTLSELVKQGELRRYNRAASRFVILKKAEVEALRERWNDTLTLFDLAIRLGIWHETILDLVDEGLLIGRKGISRGGQQEWGFRSADVE